MKYTNLIKLNNSFVHNSIGGLIQPISGVFVVLLILFYASPAAYGQYALIVSIVYLIDSIKDLGFVEYAYSVHEKYFAAKNVLMVEAGVLTTIVAGLIFIQQGDYKLIGWNGVAAIYSLSFLRMLTDYFSISLRREDRYDRLLKKDIIVNISRPILIFIVLNNTELHILNSLLVASVLVGILEVTSLINIQNVKGQIKKPVVLQFKNGAKFASNIMVQKISGIAGNRLDIVILATFLSSNALGNYSLASQIARSIPPIPLGRIQEVLLTKLLNRSIKTSRVLKITENISIVYLLGSIIFCSLIFMISHMFGEFEWHEALPIMQVFSVMWPFHALGTSIGPITRYYQKINILTKVLVVKSFISPVAISLMAPLGVNAVAFVTSVINASVNMINRFSMKKHLDYEISKIESKVAILSVIWAVIVVVSIYLGH